MTPAQRYAQLRRLLWLTELILSLTLMAGFLFSGLARRWSGVVTGRFADWPAQILVYCASLWLITVVITFPLDWFGGFRLEHRFSLSTQKFPDWLKDHAKGLAISAGFGLMLVEGLGFLLRARPENWWIWAAALWMGWSILLTRLAPTLLIPIFYRQQPLADSGLKLRLEQLLQRCQTRVRGIFEVNLSRTTQKANACLCGLGASRRVLISDTLLSRYPAEEVEVVLAHELGHHRLHHIGILLGVSTLAIAASCWVVDRIAGRIIPLLALQGLSDPATLVLIGLGLTLANLALMPITNGLSRRLEAQADRFALKATLNPTAFAATMRRLAEQNLAEITPPRWVEWLLYDHPSIGRRIAMAQQFERTA